MGGYGSGLRWGVCAKRAVDYSTTLDINSITKDKFPQGILTWKRDDKYMSSIGYGFWGDRLTLKYSITNKYGYEQYIEDTFNLDKTSVFFGGMRYWIRCPGCSKRVMKVHLPAGEKFFRCRKCYDLTYRSCQESNSFKNAFVSDLLRYTRRKYEQVKNEKESGVRVVEIPTIEK